MSYQNRYLYAALLVLLLFFPTTVAGAKLIVQHEELHTALIIRSDLVYQQAPELEGLNLRASDYIRFGWGDARYYGNFNRSSRAGLTALLVPTIAVMEVTPIDQVDQLAGTTLLVPATLEQMAILVAQISASFHAPDPEWGYALLRTGLEGQHYYPAHGKYHLFNNCNHWTARRLQFLDIRVTRLNSVFAGGIMLRVASKIDDARTAATTKEE